MIKELEKLALKCQNDGSRIALDGLEKSMVDLKNKIGDQNLKISDFINLIGDFKSVFSENFMVEKSE